MHMHNYLSKYNTSKAELFTKHNTPPFKETFKSGTVRCHQFKGGQQKTVGAEE